MKINKNKNIKKLTNVCLKIIWRLLEGIAQRKTNV